MVEKLNQMERHEIYPEGFRGHKFEKITGIKISLFPNIYLVKPIEENESTHVYLSVGHKAPDCNHIGGFEWSGKENQTMLNKEEIDTLIEKLTEIKNQLK